jgi:hypothetical protein
MITIIILHPIFGSTGMTRLIKKTNPSLPSPINGRKNKKTHAHNLTASLKIIV